ncbi:acetyl-CoA C-acetyltransferase [Paenibacillus sp. MBLB4367]|uniref:acetyl-CoA C-acetyltransferase n=1 Tax=Paenibacillus sp. MBLB4367 TaxID=3384767 RepID=UPI0039081F0B
MRQTVIIGGARTAFGKFGGGFKGVKAVELGAAAMEGALHKAGLSENEVEGIIMGMALQAGAGQIPSRQAARLAGFDWSVPSETVNKVCASGMRALTLAHQSILAGESEVMLAGGMESMSGAPFAIPAARWGLRFGDAVLTDLMIHDGLACAFDNVPMAAHGSKAAREYGITREEQDEWALRSHLRALAAVREGKFAEEIVPVTVSALPASSGVPAVMDADECPRADTDAGKLARLPPVYDQNGTITAGNAPGMNDGAAALILTSMEYARKGGYTPLAQILGHAAVGAEASAIAVTPALAVRKLLKQTGFKLEDIDLFEINEAFAAVVLASGRIIGWDAEKVNVNGGAIALGHPIGASGARIVLTLIAELKRRGGGLGIAAICSGGAQGDAVLVRVEG